MSELQSIVANSLDYNLTWCEHHYAEPWFCDWRVDPCLVIVYTPKERYRLFVKSGTDTRLFEAGNGEALLIPAGVTHRFEGPACVVRGVNIQYTLFGGIDVLSFYRVPHHVKSLQAEGLRCSIESLVKVIGRRSSLYDVETMDGADKLDMSVIVHERQFAFELLGKILELSEIRPQGEKRLLLLQKLQPALERIEDNLEQKVSIDALAETCKLSGHRFSTLFRDIMGDPPHQYILKRRMEKAMSLLSYTDDSVADIARNLGFHDQPHFTKLFKTTTGLSPTFYRKDIVRRFAKKEGSL